MKFRILVFLSLISKQVCSQNDTLKNLNFSAYGELYYSYDVSNPQNHEKSNFLYNHKRNNELNANLLLVKANYLDKNYRANIGLMAGNYAQYNLSAEPTWAQFIYEANIGVKISKKQNIWLDVGIMPSHIGFESAISKDSWTLTRSLLAENSPYYLSGIKLTYNPNDHWEFATLICNGWQRIKKVSGNSLPALGTQIKYTNGDKLIVNWSTFIGTDDPDTTRRIRYFNNFYVQSQLTKKIGFIVGFDIGAQQTKKDSSAYNVWFSPVIIVRYSLTNKWSASLRVEYYQDKNGIIIDTTSPNGFKTSGLSLNLDYSPVKNVAWRLEGRWLNSLDKIFQRQNKYINDNYFLVSSIAVSF